MSAKGRGGDAPEVGQRVVLREAAFGYEQGTEGVVMRAGRRTYYVRFETTGHTLSVPGKLLASAQDADGHGRPPTRDGDARGESDE
jgi:hypothetical protein